jgi:hypothetical protein
VGLLLMVPWVLFFRGMMPVRQRAPAEWEENVSPVLSTEERLSRLTYRRPCTRSSECEPPLGCLAYSAVREPFCSDSQCATDAQCPEGTACQVLRTEGGGVWVRLCRTVGVRKEGEECGGLMALSRERACERGLVCGNHRCGRPCRLGEPASCEEGFFCADNPHTQPSCLPTCDARGCPPGHSCIRHFSGASTCAVVEGPNCQASPCSAGQRCVVFSNPDRPEEARMQCLQDCGGEHPLCPEGHVCLAGSCRKACSSEGPDTCGPSFQCVQKDPAEPGFCQVAW